MATVEIEDFEDVEALLQRLQSHHGWQPRPRAWVFRGHRCASWRLVPSISRSDLRVAAGEHPETGDEEGLRLAEWALLRHFYRYSDAQGLPLPGESVELRELIGQARPPDDVLAGRWPPALMRDLAALAQHYGVPTRLLDWTRKPLVAAYFAVDGAAEGPDCASDGDDHGKLAIWACRRDLDPRLYAAGLRFETAPRAQIGNLHAQSGLFTIYSPPPDSGRSSLEPLDELVTSILGPDRAEPVLIELRLPRALAPELLWCLSANFVHGATVYSGYDAAWRAIRERRHRRRPRDE